MSPRSHHHLMAYTYRLRASCPPGTRIASIRRELHGGKSLLQNSNNNNSDRHDRHKLEPRSSEYNLTGSDDAAASAEKAAFDPNQTSPENEHRTAKSESDTASKSMDASPANKNLNQSKGPRKEASPSESRDATSGRSRTSGRASAPKNDQVI